MTYPPLPYERSQRLSQPQVTRGDTRRGLQLLFGFILFAGSQVAVFTPVMFSDDAADDPFEQSGELMIGMTLGAAISLVGFILIMRIVAQAPGLAWRSPALVWELLLGLLTGTAVIAAAMCVIWLLGGYQVHGITHGETLRSSLISAAAIGIGAGFMEEILFRGFGLRILDAWLGWLPALIITSLLFGGMHVGNPESSLWGALAISLEAGILLGAAYFVTRRIWLAVGIHASWNFAQGGIFGSDVSGTGDRTGLIDATWTGPDWLTGGAMGMEASVVTVAVATLAGLSLLFLANSHGMLTSKERRRTSTAQPTRDDHSLAG